MVVPSPWLANQKKKKTEFIKKKKERVKLKQLKKRG